MKFNCIHFVRTSENQIFFKKEIRFNETKRCNIANFQITEIRYNYVIFNEFFYSILNVNKEGRRILYH